MGFRRGEVGGGWVAGDDPGHPVSSGEGGCVVSADDRLRLKRAVLSSAHRLEWSETRSRKGWRFRSAATVWPTSNGLFRVRCGRMVVDCVTAVEAVCLAESLA